MKELVPITLGLVLGLATMGISPGTLRAAIRVVAAVVIGVAWSQLAGEGGPLYAAWDAAQALAAALLAAHAAQRLAGDRAAGRAPRS